MPNGWYRMGWSSTYNKCQDGLGSRCTWPPATRSMDPVMVWSPNWKVPSINSKNRKPTPTGDQKGKPRGLRAGLETYQQCCDPWKINMWRKMYLGRLKLVWETYGPMACGPECCQWTTQWGAQWTAKWPQLVGHSLFVLEFLGRSFFWSDVFPWLWQSPTSSNSPSVAILGYSENTAWADWNGTSFWKRLWVTCTKNHQNI